MSKKKLRIGFIHPDLGIGGAERLVVDAAVGLQSKGHSIECFTSHHDPSHSFQETTDGTLKVTVRGDWLPRSILSKGMILCAILRNIVLSLHVLLLSFGGSRFDILFVDQISISIPILRLTGAKILFYCHFPDKLLSKRESFIKELYRLPFDLLEELTTKMSDDIVVNSNFTAGIFKESFKRISRTPTVLYPGIHLASYDKPYDLTERRTSILKSSGKKILLSINRFERKKALCLAITAFSSVLKTYPEQKSKLRLIMAGGYDPRVVENVEHLKELESLAQEHGLIYQKLMPSSTENVTDNCQVLFIPSFTESQRSYLLSQAACLIYTPSFEHFGIVPVEAMYSSVPVIAANNGGPTESILHDVTGLLVDPTTEGFASGVTALLCLNGRKTLSSINKMKVEGNSRVRYLFSSEAFAKKLDSIIRDLASGKKTESEGRKAFTSFWIGLILTFLLPWCIISIRFLVTPE